MIDLKRLIEEKREGGGEKKERRSKEKIKG